MHRQEKSKSRQSKKQRNYIDPKSKELERQQEIKCKAEKEMYEKKKRDEILPQIDILFKRIKHKVQKGKIKNRTLKEWLRYIKCNRPTPESASNLHLCFYEWEILSKNFKLEDVMQEFEQLTSFFNIVTEITEEPVTLTQIMVKNIKSIIHVWQYTILKEIDFACYLLIRNVESSFSKIDYYTGEYTFCSKFVNIGMWSFFECPFRLNFKKNHPPIKFENCATSLVLPRIPYNTKPIVLRCMHIELDFYSTTSRSNDLFVKTATLNLVSEVKRCYDMVTAITKEFQEAEEFKQQYGKLQKEQGNADKVTNEVSSLFLPSFSSHNLVDSRRLSYLSLNSQHSLDKNSKPSIVEGFGNRSTKDSSSINSKQSFFHNRHRGTVESNESINFYHRFTQTSAVSIDMHVLFNEQNDMFLDAMYDEDDDKELIAILNETNDPARKSATFTDLFLPKEEKNQQVKSDFNSIKEVLNSTLLIKNVTDIDYEQKVSVLSKTKSQIFNMREEEAHNDFIESLKQELDDDELNLRAYTVLGGVYYIDILKCVFQPFPLKGGNYVQVTQGHFDITREPLMSRYVELSPFNMELHEMSIFENMEQEEDIEEEEESQEEYRVEEDPKDDMISVTIHLENGLFKLNDPIPVIWDEERKIWSRKHLFQCRYYKNENVVQFQLNKLAPFAFALPRFHQLPYKDWCLTPHEQNLVSLHLTCQDFTILFLIGEEKVSLENVELKNNSRFLEEIYGEPYEPDDLFFILKNNGINIFPRTDTFLYVPGSSCKNRSVEDHVYLTMSLFVQILEYCSSEWNRAVGWKNIIFQGRQANSVTTHYMTFRCNNLRADWLTLKEGTNVYKEKVHKSVGFVPDMYSLFSRLFGREFNQITTNAALISTVYYVLSQTRVLSYSGDPNKPFI
ncbi:uncharacterized protein LOC112127486 [Cimex lectularius]|uniref:Axonemal 84 kDa protein n=1 Tax=Cimex lectularius TaxID=79782 RepID=A0A8I6SS38_CIMLE|nr:uncharacterized protein LOC112127486 [Cimex lectularius]